MKRNFYLLLLMLVSSLALNSQTIVFADDFESGLTNWTVTGTWNTTTSEAYSPTNSFTDSPDGNYLDAFSSEATMAVSADLSFALDADVQFYAMLDLELGFDYVYLDASTDAGVSWTNIEIFNGEGLFTWQLYSVPLGAFVGGPDVRLRFRFVSDAAYNVDGIYIDDFVIYQYNVDVSPPLILHDATNLYEGTLGPNPLIAELLDASDIASSFLWYSTDGGPYTSIPGFNTFGDTYLFEVPEQAPGTWISYYIEATDDFGVPNTAVSDTFEIIAGNYISYDEGAIDFVADIGTLSATGYVSAAVRITLAGETDVVTAVIQNYTDYMRPNDDIQFHIWADDGTGFPGADIISPFYLSPEPTLAEPNKGTRVDLRGMPELEGIYGDVFIGYTVPGGVAWVSYTSTFAVNRSYVQTGFGWAELTGDFHFRVVTSAITGAPEALYSYTAVAEPTVNFTDLSTNSPTEWYWDFGDGTTSTAENPVHTFLSNGDFNVCLTATNIVASDTYCEIIVVDSYVAPVANFSYTGDPTVTFNDLSTNTPTSWDWDFDDGTFSTEQDPIHTFLADGTYNVCLSAINAAGSSTSCQDVTIGNTPKIPVVDFTWTISGTTVVFTDISTNLPDYWNWDFGDGGSSTEQDPSHFYPSPASYTVCLTAGNVAGEDFECKVISFNAVGDIANSIDFNIHPNPATQFLNIQIPIKDNYSAQILNTVGAVITNFTISGDQSIDISTLPSGFYLLKLDIENKIGMQSFIKE